MLKPFPGYLYVWGYFVLTEPELALVETRWSNLAVIIRTQRNHLHILRISLYV